MVRNAQNPARTTAAVRDRGLGEAWAKLKG